MAIQLADPAALRKLDGELARYTPNLTLIAPGADEVTRERIARARVREFMAAAMFRPEWCAMDPRSIINCLRAAIQLDLSIAPELGELALVPYKGVLTPQPMYKGLAKGAWRAGIIRKIETDVVYGGEPWRVWADETGRHFTHEPGPRTFEIVEPGEGGDPLDRIVAAWSLIETTTSGAQIDAMTRAELQKVRAASAAYRDGKATPWLTWPAEMCRKTTLKRNLRTIPKEAFQRADLLRAVQLQRMIQLDARVEAGHPDPSAGLFEQPIEADQAGAAEAAQAEVAGSVAAPAAEAAGAPADDPHADRIFEWTEGVKQARNGADLDNIVLAMEALPADHPKREGLLERIKARRKAGWR